MKIGYARVSTKEQETELQVTALLAAGCDVIFQEKISGVIWDREELNKALAMVKAGDEFIVWKLDRLGRTMLETLNMVMGLDGRGVVFRSLTQVFLDTSSPIGRGVLALMAAIAEDERLRILERTQAGRKIAVAKGIVFGKKTSPEKRAEIIRLGGLGVGKRAIAREVGVGAATVCRILAA